ncbi:MAG: redoxin domain-containing protein [Acidimicrobiia bacterium]|nr:redoxin domain-containing protein [Acidimicrobiia bacterium]
MEQLQGKVVLLDFWTYGCINCIHIIPDLKRLEAEYPDELVVIGVHSAKFVNESATENIRQIVLRYGLEHPVVNDADFAIWQTWGAQAWPTIVVIDPAGNVVGSHAGEGVYNVVAPVLEALVDEFDANGQLDRTPLDLPLESEGLPQTVLSFPGKVTADADRLVIADTNHHRIVVADPDTGEVAQVFGSGTAGFSDGGPRTAQFSQPQGVAIADGVLYVADTENHALRAVDLVSGEVTTLAGTGEQAWPPRGGIGVETPLSSPWDVLVHEGIVYIAMAGTHQIWAYDIETATVYPLVGNAGESTHNDVLADAELAQPSGLAVDGFGRLYFADSESSSIRWADVLAQDGLTGTLVGSDQSLFDFGDEDGIGTDARLQHPLGVAYHRSGRLFVADTYNSKIKVVDLATREITTFAGDGHGWADGSAALFYEPGGIAIWEDTLYVADTNNHAVRAIDVTSGDTRTIVLKGIERFTPAATDAAYRGEIVTLETVELAAGDGSVVLDITLPNGFKVNEDAPSSVIWQVDGSGLELEADNHSLTGTKLPVTIPVSLSEGQGTLTADLTIIYCATESEDICLIQQVRFDVPFVVGGSENSELRLPFAVEIPDSLTG